MSSWLRFLAVSCVAYALLAFSPAVRADILVPAATTAGTLVFTPGLTSSNFYVQSEVGGGNTNGAPLSFEPAFKAHFRRRRTVRARRGLRAARLQRSDPSHGDGLESHGFWSGRRWDGCLGGRRLQTRRGRPGECIQCPVQQPVPRSQYHRHLVVDDSYRQHRHADDFGRSQQRRFHPLVQPRHAPDFPGEPGGQKRFSVYGNLYRQLRNRSQPDELYGHIHDLRRRRHAGAGVPCAPGERTCGPDRAVVLPQTVRTIAQVDRRVTTRASLSRVRATAWPGLADWSTYDAGNESLTTSDGWSVPLRR